MSNLTVEAIEDQDRKNFNASKANLGELFSLPNRIVQIYDIVHQSVGPKLSSTEDKVALTLAIPQNFRHLLLGAASLYRLSASQMAREVRSAVEATGIAWLIRTNDEKYKIFKNDKGTAVARETAKNAFPKAEIFPKDQQLFRKLSKHYDEASVRAHTTFRGFFNHMFTVPGATSTEFSMNDILPRTAHLVLPNNLAWMCRAHLDIINVITKVIFAAEFDPPNADFLKLRADVDRTLKGIERPKPIVRKNR